MWRDGLQPDRFAALRASVIHKKVNRHGEFLSRLANCGYSKGYTTVLVMLLASRSAQAQAALPVLVGFGGGGREDRLCGVLPELICYRHGQPRDPDPNTSVRSLAVAVWSKLLKSFACDTPPGPSSLQFAV
jgi:hypothetical protein